MTQHAKRKITDVSQIKELKMKISPLKVGLLVVNMICLLCALGLIVIGACSWRSSFVETVLMNTKEWCLSLGIIALITCLLGSFVIIFISRVLDWLHFLAVLGLIIICLVHAIMDIVGKNEVVKKAHTHMLEAYDKHNYDLIDTFQWELQCCGYNSKFDQAVQKAHFPQELIDSCCDDSVHKCMINNASNSSCSSKVEYISTLSSIIAIFGFSNAIMLLTLAVLLVLKFIHRCRVKAKQRERYYEEDDIDIEEQDYSRNTPAYSGASMYTQFSRYSQDPHIPMTPHIPNHR